MFVSDIMYNYLINQQCDDDDNETGEAVLRTITIGLFACFSISIFVISYKKQQNDKIKIDLLIQNQKTSEDEISHLKGAVKKIKEENRELNRELKLAEEIFIKTMLLLENN